MKKTKILLISIVSLLVITITIIILFLCGAFKPKDEFAKIYGVYEFTGLVGADMSMSISREVLYQNLWSSNVIYTIDKGLYKRESTLPTDNFTLWEFDLRKLEFTDAMLKALSNFNLSQFKKKELYMVGRTYWLFADDYIFVIARPKTRNGEDIDVCGIVGTVITVKRIKKL